MMVSPSATSAASTSEAEARAPVIDLVVLDPNNPRSVAHQFDYIEAHLAALRTQMADGRLSPPQQIAIAAATKLRTAEASSIDDTLVPSIEDSLMRLSESIAATYLSYSERPGAQWEALA